ncbi:MAG TPA: hypothetical protein VGN79_12510 [Devosia sp.]|nr:hypothetical protein [Devosia sp.]
MSHPHDLTLTIHGLVDFNDEVDGEVWAEKFTAFMKGLAAADEAANGKRVHKFIVADLRKNTATAQIAEYVRLPLAGHRSGVEFYERAIDLIKADAPEARKLPAELVRSVVNLNKGASKSFQFGEIKSDGNVIYLNSDFGRAAEKVLEDIKAREEGAVHFEGQAYGSFDGVLRLVDYQHTMKKGMIWLTAGNVAVQCDIGSVPVEDVSAALEKRSVFYGLARYQANNPLPQVIEVRRIEPVAQGEGLTRWRGSFHIEAEDDEAWDSH